VVVEALELAVVQAVSELLVNEEREASRASRESIREDGLIVLLWRFEEPCIPRSVPLGFPSQAPRQRQRESIFG